MSARKANSESSGPADAVAIESRQTRLALEPGAVLVRKNGIEFRSHEPFPIWTEMTVTLQSPGTKGGITCQGIVVACTGNRHMGHHVSMVFTGLSKESEDRLSAMAATLA